MSRSVVWQRTASDAVSWHQDQALNSTIFILREIGPTSFLLKEEGESKKFKVCLGDPHICNCTNFRKEQNLCKHICWVLLKRFKLERQNDLSYQLGLVEREINGLLKGPTTVRNVQTNVPKIVERKDDGMEQRPIKEEDICPICQDQLLAKHLSVTYCRYGCGNSVHIKCMKVWADHQRQSTGSNEIQCPFCRNDFGSFSHLLKEYRNTLSEEHKPKKINDHLDSHTNVTCCVCRMSPIKGKCYKCTSCSDFHLCNSCYHGNNHLHHSFVFRVRKVQRWRPTPPRSDLGAGDLVIDTVASDLQSRELSENDYETLLELDRPQNSNGIPVDLAGLPDHVINRLPMIKVRQGGRLLAPGRQCRLCLRAYVVGQLVRQLPQCGHMFHRECIDKWLSEDHRCCPIDRNPVKDPTLPSTHASSPDKPTSREAAANPVSSDLVVPGIGLVRFSTLPAATNRTTANATQSAPHRRRSRYNFDARQNFVTSANHVTNGSITLGDILIQADAIGTSSHHNKPRSANDLDVMHIRDSSRSAPGSDSASYPLALLPDAHAITQPRQRQPSKERKVISKKPVRKMRNRPANSGTDLPLFPRNREECFELSGTSIVKPVELDVNTESAHSSPGFYTSPVVSYTFNIGVLIPLLYEIGWRIIKKMRNSCCCQAYCN